MSRSSVVCLILIALTVPLRAAGASTWEVAPLVSWLFGETSYRIDIEVEGSGSPGELVDAKSRLEFPLGVPVTGLGVRWRSSPDVGRRWEAGASVAVDVSEPDDRMTDDDWLGGAHVSHTGSDAEARVLLVNAEAGLGVLRADRADVSIVARVEYRRISCDVTGYNGWVLDEDTGETYNVSGEGDVLKYEVAYAVPQLGIRSTIGLGEGSTLALECDAGLTFASDEVDHLLRGKVSEASAVGGSLCSRAELMLRPRGLLGGRLSLALEGELRFMTADGDQTQRWYRDEGDIPAGTEISGIPCGFRSFQSVLGLRLNVVL